MEKLKLVVRYGGHFGEDTVDAYLDGHAATVDVQISALNFHSLLDMVYAIGKQRVRKLFYRNNYLFPLQCGLKELQNDEDVNVMVEWGKKWGIGVVAVYALGEEIEEETQVVVGTENDETQDVVGAENDETQVVVEAENEMTMEEEETNDGLDAEDVTLECGGNRDNERLDDLETEVDGREECGENKDNDKEESGGKRDGESRDNDTNLDSDGEMEEHSGEISESGDSDGLVSDHLEDDMFDKYADVNTRDREDDVESDDNGLNSPDPMEEEYVSEEVDTSESDIEAGPKYPVLNPATTITDSFKLEVGMYFYNRQDFKDVIAEYSLIQGRPVKFLRNESKRVRVICEDEKCKWFVYCSKCADGGNFQIRTMFDKHTCSRKCRNHMLNRRRLSQKMVEMLSDNPKISYKAINKKIKRKYHITDTKLMVCRAKKLAMEILDGSHKAQYNSLWAYCSELRRSNPGSSVLLKCQTSTDIGDGIDRPVNPVFQRFYVCMKASADGFKAGCRPFIGLDGCFVKGPYGGQLLIAVAKDPNNQYFPLAIAVVEVENNETWSWFIELLLNDVCATNGGRELTFMTDQQKGLINALERFDHRFCVNHLYNNFRKKFGGTELKKLMIAASKATYKQLHERLMIRIKEINPEAHVYLEGLEKKHCCRYTFSTISKCDDITNNICEIFNKELLEYRDLPIVSMIEGIRCYLMRWTANNRKKVARYNGAICPKIRNRLEMATIESGKWIATWAGDRKYEVESNLEKFVVNLDKWSCSCNFWDLTGIPCEHDVACIWSDNGDVETYVSHYYSKDMYEKVYQPIIYPTNGSNMWNVDGYPTLLPPPLKKMPGRPKKMRRESVGEGSQKQPRTSQSMASKISRAGAANHCRRCGQRGHNRRSCKGNGLSQDGGTHNSQEPTQHVPSSQPTQAPTSRARAESSRNSQVVYSHPALSSMSQPIRHSWTGNKRGRPPSDK